MSHKLHLILGLLLLLASTAMAQRAAPSYYVTFSSNLYLPGGDSEKSMFPMVGYSKATSPKLLLGGFGAGIAAIKPVTTKVNLKGQATIFRQSYWNESVVIYDENRNPLTDFISNSVDYAIGLNAMEQYALSERFYLGAGLGGQLLLASFTRLPELQYPGVEDAGSNLALNRYYKPFMLTLPVELSYKREHWLFAVRYEQALFNRLKGELQDYKTEKFGLLNFEVGIRIK